MLAMYVSHIPNRNSNPTWLVRESKWIDGTCRKCILANITRLLAHVRDDIRRLLKDGVVVDELQANDGSTAKVVLFTPPTKALKLLGIRLK